jgi:plasmid stabilization system protein ParE
MIGYAFHPDAFADLDEIWEYIAEDNVDAADRVLIDIHNVLRTLRDAAAAASSAPPQIRTAGKTDGRLLGNSQRCPLLSKEPPEPRSVR